MSPVSMLGQILLLVVLLYVLSTTFHFNVNIAARRFLPVHNQIFFFFFFFFFYFFFLKKKNLCILHG